MKARHTLKPVYVCLLLALSAQAVLANPLNPTVVNGQASFATTGNALTVTNTPGTIINWQGFSIGAREITRFNQQSAASAVLNRVISNNPSSILGALQSNGRVFLVNPNGIVFGAGATVDVAGLVASSLNLSNADFLAGRYSFTQVPGAANISNAGKLTAQTGGQIYLIAANVENTGVITAPNGEILLAAGHSVDLVNTSNPNLRVNITAPAGDATNVGQLIASAGSLGLFGTIVRNSGQVSADSATMQGGKIVFKAIQRTEVAGTVTSNGNTGGTIQALGNQVGVMDGATVTANGTQGGGTVLIGGDYQGKNPDVPNAQITYVAPTASISADGGFTSPSGLGRGNGGKIIVWADDTTRAFGNITAKGGVNGGNGGFIETSGHRYLDVEGIRVNAAAPGGQAGTWLLDPNDIRIIHSTSSASDSNIPGTSPFLPSSNVANSVLSDYTLNLAINGGTSVSVTTNNAGAAGNGDILFDPSVGGAITLNKTAGTYTTLALNAFRDIRFLSGTTNLQSSVSALGGMRVVFKPGTGGSGGVFTDLGAIVNLRGDAPGGWGLAAQVLDGTTWQNNGTINRDSDSTIQLWRTAFSTFQNNGILNFNSGGGWAFTSDPETQAGIVKNAGTINVNNGTSWEALYTNQAGGILNIPAGNWLSMQNANTLSGTINIGTGSTLVLSEYWHAGAKAFNSAIINGPGTLSLCALCTPTFSASTFSNLNLAASGNYTIPSTGITYSGNVGFFSVGGLTVDSNITTSGTLTLVAGWDGTSPLNNPVVANPGNLNVSGTLSAGAVVVYAPTFTLSGGTWNQVSATLPGFTVNDFRIAGGTFIRALGGDGGVAPYQLTDIYGVQGMGSTGMLNKSYVLANNIDASGTTNWNEGAGFLPVGSSDGTFAGQFDGLNHTISNLIINRTDQRYVGLFGYTSGSSALRNVGLVGGSVSGSIYVGGLAGKNYGSISNAYATGSVNGTNFVGGLVGFNAGTVGNAYATGSVTGISNNVGGLAGYNDYSGDTISNSYATGSVNRDGSVGGGLVGLNNGAVRNSFWATQTSDQTSSGAGTGMTTAQMQQQANFTSSTPANGNVNPDWDFAGTWVMYNGHTYPLLRSFMTQLTVTANNDTKTYDGQAYSGGNGVSYSSPPNANLLGTVSYIGSSQGAINSGNYVITPGGLYSNQQGYLLSYVDGALTVNPAPATAPATTPVVPQPVISSLVSMSIPAINVPFNPPVSPVLMQAPTIDEINLLGPTAAGSDNPDDQAARDAAAAGTASVTVAEAAPLPVCR